MQVPGYAASLVVGLSLYMAALQRPWAVALATKAFGGDAPCSWSTLLKLPFSVDRFAVLQKDTLKELRVESADERFGIELILGGTRPFWIKKEGSLLDGMELLAYVIAEQEWISESAPEYGVRPGDVVVDVGAHIGTFGADAFQRGAAKVIMVEPDPINVECIRRNFPTEISAGKVIVVPEGAWSKTDTLQFNLGVANSGTGSFVLQQAGLNPIKMPVRRLDEILESAGIKHVSYIKMDIEGAEREALKGATMTLAESKPRLMLDMYHRSDDATLLPEIIMTANPRYRSFCAACSPQKGGGKDRIVPYAMFFY